LYNIGTIHDKDEPKVQCDETEVKCEGSFLNGPVNCLLMLFIQVCNIFSSEDTGIFASWFFSRSIFLALLWSYQGKHFITSPLGFINIFSRFIISDTMKLKKGSFYIVLYAYEFLWVAALKTAAQVQYQCLEEITCFCLCGMR
jgi:hypothetical protein